MSPETFSAILGGLTDGVVGAFLGFLGAFLLFRLSQRRKVIEYSVSSISLLRLKPATDSILRVSVSKAVLTGDITDQNDMLPLNTVYGFQITLVNIGNEDIEKIDDIEIRLDASAKIVRCETEPPSTLGYSITTRKDQASLNVLHLSVPYMNAKTSMIIRLISTENANSSCTVTVHGVGIRTRSARSPRITLILGATISATFLIMGVVFSLLDMKVHHLPLFFNDPSGWISVISPLCGVLVFLYASRSSAIKEKRQEFSQDWDWKVPEASKKQNFLQKWFS